MCTLAYHFKGVIVENVGCLNSITALLIFLGLANNFNDFHLNIMGNSRAFVKFFHTQIVVIL